MVDQSGREVWSADISVWGKLRNQNGEKQHCPFRWPGQYEDEETGLYYNRFRYYDPNAGQYVSQDPIGLVGSNPNEYAYVKDPLTILDFFGLIIVYRGLTEAQEKAAQAGQSIEPKNPSANYTIQEHIEDGSRETQFNSTTKSQKTAEFYAQPNPKRGKTKKSMIIEIDTDKLDNKFFDVSSGIDPQTGAKLKGKAFGWAKKDKELLIEGAIPKKAYKICS